MSVDSKIKDLCRPATYVTILLLILLMQGCVSSRYVPEGKYMLDKVDIVCEDTASTFNKKELMNYVRQLPNHKVLGGVKLRLGVYNMSGKDTTKWYNRWWRRMGEPPVVYDSTFQLQSIEQLQKVLVNKGFLHAAVTADTIVDRKKRKIKVNYNLHPGLPHVIKNISYVVPADTMGDILLSDTSRLPLRSGMYLDRSLLELQREMIVQRMRNRGYYAFSKEFIRFNADTTLNSCDVDLTMSVDVNDALGVNGIEATASKSFVVSRVVVITDYLPGQLREPWDMTSNDIINYKGIEIQYGEKRYLSPSVLFDNCFIHPGDKYREHNVQRTYQAFSRLSILNFINIRFKTVGELNGEQLLECYILLTAGKSQSMSVSIEGTNSEGDLGVALGLGYSHRNIGKGSETLTAKVRGAYEALDGKFEGLLHNRYMEYSVEANINFPKFKAPFLKDSFKRRINASTEFNISLNYQERPEYTRIVSTAGWAYKWTERRTHNRHTFTPIDINYVYLPESTNGFLDLIAPDNPLLRYSYEDHFIMRMGYSFYHTNKRTVNDPLASSNTIKQKNIYTIRVNTEIAGNLLFALSSIFAHRSDFHTVPYKVFGINYSQYLRTDADYTFTHFFNHRHSLASHAGFGIGVPYGNSRMLPFEKRFYGGGANGVRGWSVRTLGPGRFPGTNSQSDFIHQCGDIRLDLSLEYRMKLLWVVEGALFVDAGNIWTIHNYEGQQGGMFKFNSFYKEIAAAYGAGLRLDFTYFLLRFDLGMKAHNPAMGEEPWPLIHPRWKRDSAFHFSIGYPF